MKITIWIAGYGRNPHVRAFEDFTFGLASACRRLGHEVAYDPGKPIPQRPGRLIVFGAHTLAGGELPVGTIIFNTEQIGQAPLSSQYLALLGRYAVWDYSLENIRRLGEMGITAMHCPVGYDPAMTKDWPEVEEDIDVLHYGSVNPRRHALLEAVQGAGLHVEALFGRYGAERDAFVRRSKIVLNLHYYDQPIFEIFRVSHLLANGKCVVTEGGGVDANLETLAQDACLRARGEALASICTAVVRESNWRVHGRRGFNAFSQVDLAESVRRALAVVDSRLEV